MDGRERYYNFEYNHMTRMIKKRKKYDNLLWCDLKNDLERIEFIQFGRGVETGIIAPSLICDFLELLKFRLNKGVRDNE